MKNCIILLFQSLLMVFLLEISVCKAQSDTLTSDKVQGFVDKQVIVKGTVASFREFGSGMLLLNIDKPYPNNNLSCPEIS